MKEVKILNDEKCTFVGEGLNRFCKILSGVKCLGNNENCSFRKTEKQFIEDRDRAIALNRLKGNCEKCKYMGAFCKTSAEEMMVDNFF